MNCIHCGTPLPEGTRFCTECGAAQQTAAPQQSPQTQGNAPQQQPGYTAPQAPQPSQSYAASQPGYAPQQPQSFEMPQQDYAAPQQSPQQGYVPPQPVQPQGNVPPQPQQNYYAPQPQNFAAPQSPAEPPKKGGKSRGPLIVGVVAAIAVIGIIFAVVLPKINKPKPGQETTAPVAETTSPAAPTPPAGYTSPDVGEVITDVAQYTYFDIRQGLDEPMTDKVFEAPNTDGWGDFYTIQLNELTLHNSIDETPFTITLESVCSSSYAYLSDGRYYGDGLDVEAHMVAQTGEKYLFRIKTTDGEDWSYYIYDKDADTLSFLGNYSRTECRGNYLLLRPYNELSAEAPLFVYDWAGIQIREYESVYDYEEHAGALYLLSGYDVLSLDLIPLDRFETTQFDVTTEHLADYPDYTGLFARTQGGDLQLSLVRADGGDLRIADIADAAQLADDIRRDPAPAAAPIKASCDRFSVEIPAFFKDYVEIEKEVDGIYLYGETDGGLLMLYALQVFTEEDYNELMYCDRVVYVLKGSDEDEFLVELNCVDTGAFPYESSAAYDAMSSRLNEIAASVEFLDGTETKYPSYHELPTRYDDPTGNFNRLRIVGVDGSELHCSFCTLDYYKDVDKKMAFDVKMVGNKGLLFDGSHEIGYLRLEDGYLVLCVNDAPDPELLLPDAVMNPVE